MEKFVLDLEALQHPRVHYVDDLLPLKEYLSDIEHFINVCFVENGFDVVQKGRVIALRHTDKKRLVSAFKAAIYLGRYNNMNNVQRFLKNMVSAHHSYEPIRGELILFLFIGVGKPVYDHLVTYTTGRPTRIAGGQRANLPWGYEVPAEIKQGTTVDLFIQQGLDQVRRVIQIVKGTDEEFMKQQIQVVRSLLPVGYIMPPFLLEFSEEALIKTVFKQRIFEAGAQGATVDVVKNMWECVMEIDEEKWSHLYDYHGPHIAQWEKVMRTLRDKAYSLSDIADLGVEKELFEIDETDGGIVVRNQSLYDILMTLFGQPQKSMWDK